MVVPIGLYYPYTHFRSSGWLKTAALYWPQIARIVPQGMRPHCTDPVERALRDELDFVFDVEPDDEVKFVVGSTATSALVRLDEEASHPFRVRPEAVRDISGIPMPPGFGFDFHGDAYFRRIHELEPVRVDVRFPGLEPEVHFADPALPWPKPVAFSPDATFGAIVVLDTNFDLIPLLEVMRELGVAVFDSEGTYAAVHPNFAWAYMCMLADEVAASNALVPVSDDPYAYGASGNWTDKRFLDRLLGRDVKPDHSAEHLGSLALRLVVPSDPASVPVDRIIAVRQRYGAEFDAFHELVAQTSAELVSELGELSNPTVMERYLNQTVSRRFDVPLQQLQKAMRGVGVDAAVGAASVKFEVPAAAAMAAGWAAGQPVLAAAGAAFGLASWYRTLTRDRNLRLQGSPVSYLWLVDRHLNGPSMLRNLLRPR